MEKNARVNSEENQKRAHIFICKIKITDLY